METNIETFNLTNIPIFSTINPDHEKIADKIKDFIYEYEKETIQSDVARQIKYELSEPPFDFFKDENIERCPELGELLQYVMNTMTMVVKRLNQPYWDKMIADSKGKNKIEHVRWKIYFTEGWYHLTKGKGGFHGYHMHPNCSWGWIYYFNTINIDKYGGGNSFLSPAYQAQYYNDPGSLWINNRMSTSIPPTKGKLIMFPTFLLHNAEPYYGDEDRIVLACNCRVLSPDYYEHVAMDIIKINQKEGRMSK